MCWHQTKLIKSRKQTQPRKWMSFYRPWNFHKKLLLGVGRRVQRLRRKNPRKRSSRIQLWRWRMEWQTQMMMSSWQLKLCQVHLQVGRLQWWKCPVQRRAAKVQCALRRWTRSQGMPLWRLKSLGGQERAQSLRQEKLTHHNRQGSPLLQLGNHRHPVVEWVPVKWSILSRGLPEHLAAVLLLQHAACQPPCSHCLGQPCFVAGVECRMYNKAFDFWLSNSDWWNLLCKCTDYQIHLLTDVFLLLPTSHLSFVLLPQFQGFQ